MLLEPRSAQEARCERAASPPPAGRRRPGLPLLVVGGSLLLAALSVLGPTTPTYDPWAWILWGREVAQGDLVTTFGPSWKPLPVLFTTVFSLLGDAAPTLWVLVARAGALAGVAVAFLLGRRLAGTWAGLAAALGVALSAWTVRNAAFGNSEGLLVAFGLAAVLAHDEGRRGWAFAFAVGAALLRPEAWPFVGLYALWLVVRERRRLPWVAGGLAVLPVLWLGPELWGSGNAFRASDRAQQPRSNSPAFADHPSLEVVRDLLEMLPVAALAGGVLAIGLALARRFDPRRRALIVAVAGVALAWAGLVAAMTEAGFSGNQRYLVLPAALLIVLGAAGLVQAARLVRPAAAAAVLGAGVVAAFAVPSLASLPALGRSIEYQDRLTADLAALVDRHGAERLLACGRPVTGRFLVPAVAWHLGTHLREVGFQPPPAGTAVLRVRTTASSPFEPRPGVPPAARPAERIGGWELALACRGRS